MPEKIIDTIVSKICHDLISPVGAIHNGIEIMREMGGVDDDVIGLIDHSTSQASAKLKAFRIAYGEAGNDDMLKPEDAYNCIEELIENNNKVTQNWNSKDQAWFDEERGKGFCKLLLGLLMLGIDCLPRGGTLTATRLGKGFVVTADGEGANIRSETQTIADSQNIPDTIQTNQVHAYIIVTQAKRYGYKVHTEQTENSVSFTCSL